MNRIAFAFGRDFQKQSLWPVVIAVGMGCLLSFLLGGTARAESKRDHIEGGDLVFGGTGNGPGEFTILLDMTFDPQGNLYTLEGGGPVTAGKTVYNGTARVQKFDSEGKYLSEFPLGDDIPADSKSWPGRLAVDGGGNVYVAFPVLGFVRQYGPDGKKIRDDALPGAEAVAFDAAQGRVAAIARAPIVVNGHQQTTGGDQIVLLDPNGGAPQSVQLPRQIHNVNDLAVDKKGSFYIQGGDSSSQIFVFDAKGQLLKSIGSGMFTHSGGPSEPIDTVAVDSQGSIYNTCWGAPGGGPAALTKYTADGKWVLQRRPLIHDYESWNVGGYDGHPSGMLLAVAPDDRVWAASIAVLNPEAVNISQEHWRPAIIRTDGKFFDPTAFGVTRSSARTLGFAASLQCALPSNVTQTLAPIQDEFVVGAAVRQVSAVEVAYHVYDYFKKEVAGGTLKVPLQDGVEARAPFSFTPPCCGWYMVEAEVTGGGERLAGIFQQIGVTPVYANMPVKPEEFVGGWEDMPRQMFCGLPTVRLAAYKGLDALDGDLTLGAKYGTTYFVQLDADRADFTVEKLRPIIERFKGRVPYYELFNEPNLSFAAKDFVEKAKPIYQMIKEVDPRAQVLGPTTCGINLGWIEQFYQAGGAQTMDIMAVHDWEGHESIVAQHWRWKLGALRDLMTKYGDGKKEIWQTERGCSIIRGGVLTAQAQAVRTLLKINLLETLGVPPEHDYYYYLNEGGYAGCQTFLWGPGSQGPYPAVLTLRTRETLTQGRKYAGEIDFGPTGNKMLLGLRYEGGDGTLVSVENLGTADLPIDMGVQGGDAVEVIDSFGNVKSLAVTDGHVTLPIPQLPVYFHLKPGQELSFPKIDFGQNIASTAQITYAGHSEGALSLLQNGILETYQAGDPNGDTDGKKIWKGDIQKPGQPQYLGLQWKEPQSFDSVVLFGTHADNGFCALLDYDLQAWQDGAWKTISQVRTPVPATDDLTGYQDILGMTWLEDNNFSASHFPAVTTNRLRIVFLRTTSGFDPDETAAQMTFRSWGNVNPPRPMLTEIEIYAAKAATQVTAGAQ